MSDVVMGKPVERDPNARRSPYAVPPVTDVAGLLADAPALNRADWLPEGAFPELEELRTEHVRLLDEAFAVAREIADTRQRHEAEGEAYAEAQRAQARGESVKLPKLTTPEERAAELAPLEARAKAITEVREQFARGAVATIIERHGDWSDELDAHDREAERRVEEARAELAKAEAALGATVQLRAWIDRTAGHHPMFKQLDGRHIAFSDLTGANGTPEITTEGGSNE